MTPTSDAAFVSDAMRARPIALVATDLDGTLLGSQESVSERTRRAAHAAVAAGIEFVLVTGRPPRWLPPVLEQLELQPTCVCANGAVIVEPSNSEITYLAALDPTAVLHAASVLRKVMPEVGFAIEQAPPPHDVWSHGTTFAHDHEYRPRWVVPVDVPVGPLESLLGEKPVVKLLARSELVLPQSAVDDIVAAARAELGEHVEVTHSERDRLLLEVSASGVDKGTALARVAAARGIDAANVAAVGDMLNDLPMLLWAGHPFAVGNAHESLKSIGRLLPTNDDDAVAQLLEAVTAIALDQQ